MKPRPHWPTLIVTVILPLLLGGLTYILFRANTLKMFGWFNQLGLSGLIGKGRNALQDHHSLPAWMIYSLPDALWLFSFTNLMLFLWNYRLTRQSIYWIFLAPIIGLLSEAGQAVQLVPGTFDITDMILLCAAAITPFIINPLYKSIKTQPV